MLKNCLSSVFLVAVLVLVGCEKSARPEEKKVEEGQTGIIKIFSSPADLVLVEIGDKKITVGEVRNRSRLGMEIARLSFKDKKDCEQRVFNHARTEMPGILPSLINGLLIKNYLLQNGVGLTIPDEDKVLKQKLRNFRWTDSFEAFVEQVQMAGEFVKDQFLLPERLAIARDHFDPHCGEVSEEEIAAGLARMEKFHELAVETNRVNWAICSNVLSEVKAGMDFAAAGEKYSQVAPEEAKVWEDADIYCAECPTLKEWAHTAPVGAFGGPFELEDGLSIVKLLDRKEEVTDGLPLAENEHKVVSLARITFVLAEEEPEPRTHDYVEKTLRRWKQGLAEQKLIEKLFSENPQKFPCGEEYEFDIISPTEKKGE